MRVSIITPTYNRADLLPETIDSILSQGYPDLEYIVLDDGSKDDTQEVLARYAGRIVSVRHDNMGETATVNKGFAMATGDIVCVVCSDDPVLPGLIAAVVDAFQKNPDAVAVYPDWVDIGPRSDFLRMVRLPDYDIRTMLLTLSWGLGPGAFFRRSLVDKLGGRNPKRVYCGDMEFWALAAMQGTLIHVPKVLATHRTHDGSASVGQRGGGFAREWVETFRALFESPALPRDLLPNVPFLFGHVYLVASGHYCGNNRIQALKFRYTGQALLASHLLLGKLRCWCGGSALRLARPVFRVLKEGARKLARPIFWLMKAVVRWRHDLIPGAALGLPPVTLRFAVCTRFTPPLWSGQAVVIGRMLGGLSPDKYCLVSLPLYTDKQDAVDFTPALPGTRYLLPQEKELRGASRVPSRFRGLWRKLGLLYQAWQRGVNIARTLKDDPADTIVGCSGDLLDLPAAWLASQLLARRFVVHFYDDYMEQWWADPELRAFAGRIEKRIVRDASKILVTNEYMQTEIGCRHGRSAEIVRNPCQESDGHAILTHYPTSPDEVRVVFTGAVYHLNYDILRAITQALSQIEGALHRLHIYTAQPKEQLEAEGLVGPHVCIHGHVTPAEASEIQRNADILLIPFSFHEDAKGIIRTAATAKLADYLAAGRPILAVCQEDSFLAWFLQQQGCGISVATDDPAEIAQAIRNIGDDPALRLRMRENACRVVASEFSPAASQGRLLAALDLISLPAHLRVPAPPSRDGQLKVVQVSAMDLVGIQVNGFLTHKWLQERGHDSRMLVYSRMSNDPCVREVGTPLTRTLNPLAFRLESRLNSTSMLPLASRNLDKDPWIRDADIVHLQLLHAAPFFSLLGLPRLARKKKVLFSVHDMFLMTGHCIYSMGCDRWKSGCGQCPDLGLPFAVSNDVSSRNWKLKHWAFERSKIDLVVGSPWQEEQVRQSPILRDFRRHMIPYGVDTRVFKVGDKRSARRQMGIPEDAHVITFRSAPFHRNFKGTNYIQDALRRFSPRRPTVLLTFETRGGFEDMRDKYELHEFGFVVDSAKIALGLQAADIFLMPSTAEAFGLMAIESMACGTPTIVFDGTALPETIGGPECGVIVPQGDAAALTQAIEDCLDNPDKLDLYRQNGLRHVASKHGFEDYAQRHLDLYQELAKEQRYES